MKWVFLNGLLIIFVLASAFGNNSEYDIAAILFYFLSVTALFSGGFFLASSQSSKKYYEVLIKENKNLVEEKDELIKENSINVELIAEAKSLDNKVKILKDELNSIKNKEFSL